MFVFVVFCVFFSEYLRTCAWLLFVDFMVSFVVYLNLTSAMNPCLGSCAISRARFLRIGIIRLW